MAGLMRGASPGPLVHERPGPDHGLAFPSLLSPSLRACMRSRQAVAAFVVAMVLVLAALSQVADVGHTRGPPPEKIGVVHAKGEGPLKSEVPAKSEGGASEEEGEEGPDPRRPSKCPEGCAANGVCNEETGECHCVPSQEGPACASPALPRCQLAPGYSSPCSLRLHPTTCECAQDCQKFRLPVGNRCVRGTQADGSLNPNLTEVYEGEHFWTQWRSNGTELAVPDYGVERGEELREKRFLSPLECPNSCSGRGVCNRLKACECPWLVGGPTCQETFRQSLMAGGPASACLNACSARGRCDFGTCRCDKGFFGIDCSLYIDKAGQTRLVHLAPYKWASLPVRDAPQLRPRVYVYDLPGYFNTWLGVHSGTLDWEEPVWFLERLLNSPYRTADPDEADFFYIPLFIRLSSNNRANVVVLAKEYIRKRWPHFDRSGGANHIVLTNSDWGNCVLGGPGGYRAMSTVLEDLMTLTLWGMSKNMTYGDDRPCFRPGRDIVIPPIMKPEVYSQAPDILSDESGAPEDRPILCYFRGSSYVDAKSVPGEYVMSHHGPDVYQPFEGDGLNWDEFSVRMRYEDIPNLEAILRSYSAEQVQGLQRGMRAVRRRFMWSSTSLNPFAGGGFTPEDVEKGAQQLEDTDVFVTVMDALRLRLKL